MKEPENIYKVAEIAMTPSGEYKLIWIGTHADQGGPSWRNGSIGFENLKGLAHGVEHFLGRDEEEFKKKIAERETKKDEHT